MSAELSTLSKISKIDQEIFFLGILPTACSKLELLLYDLLGRKIITSSWINFLIADSDVIQDVSLQDLVSFIEGSQKLNAAGSWIFFSSSILGDLILIYRCYRLWNSKKYVIILPVLFLLTTLVVAIWSSVSPRLIEGVQDRFQGNTSITYSIYIFADIGQGSVLTVLLASRLWWLNRKTEKLLGKSKKSTLWKLTEIVLESGLLLPLFLAVAWIAELETSVVPIGLEVGDVEKAKVGAVEKAEFGLQVLSTCALTQVAGIASTLIIVRIGLGVDAQPSQSPDVINVEMDNIDVESAPEQLEIATNFISPAPAFLPFLLKYNELPRTSKPAVIPTTAVGGVTPFSLKY
ncbi:hypothetical protein BT96DRAFT_969585 [Gymnopus androsaceus JB14]|uniref:Uncharacterized protein n=1 Tax=Gymnopus androsaceus JB14 TaxID=1447944 RepID=A0A6A4IRI5_9AGAR|nr:hypothetical protein BT96DRAFT_969585 [Gymnopus androsaceus JB14]